MTTKTQIGPQKICESETEGKKKNNTILKVIKENIIDEVKKEKSPATIFKTPEYQLLNEKNTEIDIYNEQYQEIGMGRQEKKQKYILQRQFKQEKFEKYRDKRCIDEFCYREELLVPLLYLFYKQV